MKVSPKYITKKHLITAVIVSVILAFVFTFMFVSDTETGVSGLKGFILAFFFFLVVILVLVGGMIFLSYSETERERRGVEKILLPFAKTGKGSGFWLFLLRISPQLNPAVALFIYIVGITFLYLLPQKLTNYLNTDVLVRYLSDINQLLLPILTFLFLTWILVWFAVRERARFFLQINSQGLSQKKTELGPQYTSFLKEGITFLTKASVAKWDSQQRQAKQLRLLNDELKKTTSE